MSPLRRIVLWVVLGLAALFVAAAVALTLLLPRAKILARVQSEAESHLGRRVTLTDAGVSFWPPFGIYVRGFKIANRPPATEELLLDIGYARGRLVLARLLTGDVVLDQVELQSIRFTYERFDDSTSNISDLLAGEDRALPPLVEHLRLSDLSVQIARRTDSVRVDLHEISAAFRLDASTRAFSGELGMPRWSWQRAAESSAGEDPVAVRVAGTYAPDSGYFSLEEIEATVVGVPCSGHARIWTGDSLLELAADVELGPIELAHLVRQLPPSRRALLESYDVGGELRGGLHLPRSPLVWPLSELSGELVWLGGHVRRGDIDLLRCASITIPIDSAGFHVSGDGLTLVGGPLQMALVGRWTPAAVVEANLTGRINMRDIEPAAPWEGVEGLLSYALTVQGPIREPGRWSVKLRAGVEGVTYMEPGRDPLSVSSGALDYDGVSLRAEQWRVHSGPSQLTLSAVIDGLDWSTLLSRPSGLLPVTRATAQSSYLDLDRLFPALAHDSAAPRDTAAVPGFPELPVDVDLAVDTLVLGGMPWRDVTAALHVDSGQLTIDTLYGYVCEGHVGMRGELDFNHPDTPAYHVSMRLDSAAIGMALARFGRVGRHLRGRGNIVADIAGRGTEPEQIAARLFAEGRAELYDARLEGVEAGTAVLSLLGLSPRDPIPIKSRWNRFKLEAGRVHLDAFEFDALQSRWHLRGAVGLDGKLDYVLDATLSPELSKQLRLPESFLNRVPQAWRGQIDPVALLKDDDGRAQVFLKVGGSYREPDVKLDMDRMGTLLSERFESRVVGHVSQTAEEKLKRGLQQLLGPKKP